MQCSALEYTGRPLDQRSVLCALLSGDLEVVLVLTNLSTSYRAFSDRAARITFTTLLGSELVARCPCSSALRRPAGLEALHLVRLLLRLSSA